MRTTKTIIKNEFKSAEENLEFCWSVLSNLKRNSFLTTEFGNNFIAFQEKLASTIFSLQSLRDKIIRDEKFFVKNKADYDKVWFENKMRLLSKFKKGVDSVIYIARSLGDAYAYFFYQNDRELLTKHLNHQRIENHSFSSGKKGELEFLKRIKHIDGYFTLFHDITHILRYGDFSFIDLKSLKIKRIGELKTETINPKTLESKLSMFDREQLELKNELIKDKKLEKTREGRQILDIANLFIKKQQDVNNSTRFDNTTYSSEIENLISSTKIRGNEILKVGPGLAFTCYKQKKASLYTRIFNRKIDKDPISDESSKKIRKIAQDMIKSDSKNNAIIMSGVLYDHKLSDKTLRGSIPLFWHPIKLEYLYKLYFTDCIIFSMFNPAHLIEEIKKIGYEVKCRYSSKDYKGNIDKNVPRKTIENFHLFYPYITTYLMNENFIKKSILNIEKNINENQNQKISIIPQLSFE